MEARRPAGVARLREGWARRVAEVEAAAEEDGGSQFQDATQLGAIKKVQVSYQNISWEEDGTDYTTVQGLLLHSISPDASQVVDSFLLIVPLTKLRPEWSFCIISESKLCLSGRI